MQLTLCCIYLIIRVDYSSIIISFTSNCKDLQLSSAMWTACSVVLQAAATRAIILLLMLTGHVKKFSRDRKTGSCRWSQEVLNKSPSIWRNPVAEHWFGWTFRDMHLLLAFLLPILRHRVKPVLFALAVQHSRTLIPNFSKMRHFPGHLLGPILLAAQVDCHSTYVAKCSHLKICKNRTFSGMLLANLLSMWLTVHRIPVATALKGLFYLCAYRRESLYCLSAGKQNQQYDEGRVYLRTGLSKAQARFMQLQFTK